MAKAQNMVSFYGAGERTGILNVENKLAKALGKDTTKLVVRASERDAVLNEISARAARYEKFDPEMYQQLKALRQDVRDIFNKGLPVGDHIMEQLYFLDPKTRDFVEKMTRAYDSVVTPDDFKIIAGIMSENLAAQTPILRDFSRFFGRLAEDFMIEAKPSNSAFDAPSLLKTLLFGSRRRGYKLPTWLNRIMGIKDEAIRDKLLNRIPGYDPNAFLTDVLLGTKAPTRRRTGFKIGKYSIFSEDITKGFEVGVANKLDKKWTNIPWVNFDGKVLEQNFTQVFEEKISYKDAEGKWVNNILQVPQKTDPTKWEEFRNKSGKMNDIADVSHARTAYGVNGNHSNDATLVKQYHLWAKKVGIGSSTVHDAFVCNAAKMLDARQALRGIYANAVSKNSIKATLDELLARGLPKETYNKYLNEAIETGLIPVPGRSRVGGRLLTEDDILKPEDVLKPVKENFSDNNYWYGIS